MREAFFKENAYFPILDNTNYITQGYYVTLANSS